MPSDYYLLIDGIKGESSDDKHKGEIDIDSFSWGVSQPGVQRTGAAGGSGRATFQDLTFSKGVDASSPELFLACASGKHFPKATLTGVRSGEEPFEYYKVTLEDCLVSSYQTGGSEGSDVPMDQFSLNFATIVFTYTPQGADGRAGAPVSAGWNLGTNTKI